MSGVSTVPILPNGTKRAAIKWGEFQTHLPPPELVDQWWANGQNFGLALICGRVSGNLEMLELEDKACSSTALTQVLEALARLGLLELWTFLNGPEGYSEWSPSGGLHLLYRISDHEVPGNAKIAWRPATEAELAENPLDKYKVLAETRGEGGYVVVAPTSGLCHPTGEAWTLINGSYGRLPVISWEQRNLLHEALRLALDSRPYTVEVQAPAPSSAVVLPRARGEGAGLSPLDDMEQRVDWAEILEPHGWKLVSSSYSGERHWRRPGKTDPGASATTGHCRDRERMYNFSSSTNLPVGQSMTKGYVYAILNFGGDLKAAAQDLRRRGFGSRPESVELVPKGPSLDPPPVDEPSYPNNDDGNSQYLRDKVDGNFTYIVEEKRYYVWDGRVWGPDWSGRLEHEFKTMAAQRLQRSIEEGNKVDVTRWTQAGNVARTEAALKMMRSIPGVSARYSDMNPDRHLLNVVNGILDLDKRRLIPHDPARKMTRMFGAAYDPEATCPRFEQFMADVLPDPGMRGYVQRALGYTLLGDVDQRAMFLIYGPSGTGKSTLMEVMREVFGDYGATAAAGAFRAPSRDSAPTNDLHDLRGRRFVTTSETAEGASFNEDLLKRLTGRDRVKSRELYQSNQEWVPECVIWLATNHPPRFNSDDDAIWRRAKMIPFMTKFLDEREVPDMARAVLAPEASGILNWLLDGLSQYLAMGLVEPEEVRQSAEEQRLAADSVARFLDDRVSEGVLLVGDQQKIRSSDLYTMYLEWARQTGERGLGSRRFMNRLTVHPFNLSRLDHGVWVGVGRSPTASILGTFFGPAFAPDS